MSFVRPDNIFVGDRLRALDRETVERLKKSIARIGLKTPISVHQIEDRDEMYGLVTGRHRLQACIELGFDKIEVRKEDETELDAKLWEIAENLDRAELTVQERSEHIAEWVRLTEEKAAATSGANCATKPGHGQGSVGGLRAAVRELGIERTEAQRAVKRTENIAPEVRNEIRGTDIGNSGVQLDALAKAKDAPDRQLAAVRAVKAGEVKDVRDVLQPDWKAPAPPPPPTAPARTPRGNQAGC